MHVAEDTADGNLDMPTLLRSIGPLEEKASQSGRRQQP